MYVCMYIYIYINSYRYVPRFLIVYAGSDIEGLLFEFLRTIVKSCDNGQVKKYVASNPLFLLIGNT